MKRTIANIELPDYKYPTHKQLDKAETKDHDKDNKQEDLWKLISALIERGIYPRRAQVIQGPTTTTYKLTPRKGAKITQIKKAREAIALKLATDNIRMIAPSGEKTVHVEVPRKDREIVTTAEVVQTKKWGDEDADLPIVIGKTTDNKIKTIDLRDAPHMLVAGATGQGKSVAINNYITGLTTKRHPSEMKMVLVDPKRVELSMYKDLDKHYLADIHDGKHPIVTETEKVKQTLDALIEEMEDRYEVMQEAKVRDINEYNEKFINNELNVKEHEYKPYIVMVIDEFADFIMDGGEEVEQAITKLAQKARATGIHMIVATQRPSVDVITGNIKANMPTRVAFKVTSKTDSRVILDENGAEKLMGKGDVIIKQDTEVTRCQTPFISTEEAKRVVDHISKQKGYERPYRLDEGVEQKAEQKEQTKRGPKTTYEEVKKYIKDRQENGMPVGVPATVIEGKFDVTYKEAKEMAEQLKEEGVLG